MSETRRGMEMVAVWMKNLKSSDADLEAMLKGALERKAKTTLLNAWIAKKLRAGHPANVLGYVKTCAGKLDRKTLRMVRILKFED